MFNITSHQGNADKNHNETSYCTLKNGYHQKKKKKPPQITSAGEDVEKKEPRAQSVGI